MRGSETDAQRDFSRFIRGIYLLDDLHKLVQVRIAVDPDGDGVSHSTQVRAVRLGHSAHRDPVHVRSRAVPLVSFILAAQRLLVRNEVEVMSGIELRFSKVFIVHIETSSLNETKRVLNLFQERLVPIAGDFFDKRRPVEHGGCGLCDRTKEVQGRRRLKIRFVHLCFVVRFHPIRTCALKVAANVTDFYHRQTRKVGDNDHLRHEQAKRRLRVLALREREILFAIASLQQERLSRLNF
mmetsp:Transcript_11598/g.35440  ORF Transcript_11598/g.35440 Transcript_11598/m.35440 type:complete len:239 (-) Transcript_11598:394-1110(-)